MYCQFLTTHAIIKRLLTYGMRKHASTTSAPGFALIKQPGRLLFGPDFSPGQLFRQDTTNEKQASLESV